MPFANRLAVRHFTLLAAYLAALFCLARLDIARACCPLAPPGKFIVNADQNVIIVWDAANKVEHFIRQASFTSDTRNIGFIIPTPSQPRLAESSQAAFESLAIWTEPEVQLVKRIFGVTGGCSASPKVESKSVSKTDVQVLEAKQVAGFNAVVLEATSGDALSSWLTEHGYELSSSVAAWAEPYIKQGWRFTALQVAKGNDARRVDAKALRLSFATDQPLFPYREPSSSQMSKALNAADRTLRIFFVAENQYDSSFSLGNGDYTGMVWSNVLSKDQSESLLEQLQLQADVKMKTAWLTEFAHTWPYADAPADLYFKSAGGNAVPKRKLHIEYVDYPQSVDLSHLAISALLIGLLYRVFRARPDRPSLVT